MYARLFAVLLLIPIGSPLVVRAQWTFQGVFPSSDFNAGSGHGIAVAADGTVWFQPALPSESVSVTALGGTEQPANVIYVFTPDGHQTSFSPITFVDLPGGTRDTLGGELVQDTSGAPAWTTKLGWGLRSTYDGHIVAAQGSYLYMLDYRTGAGLARTNTASLLQSTRLTTPTVDANGHVYVSSLAPEDPLLMFDASLSLLGAVLDGPLGNTPSFEVTADGHTLFWPRPDQQAVILYQRSESNMPFDSLGLTLEGFASESVAFNRASDHLWLSAGSLTNRPNQFPGVSTTWSLQTWYGFEISDILAQDQAYTSTGSFTWNPDFLEGRPRGIAFSIDGRTAYATQSNQPVAAMQTFALITSNGTEADIPPRATFALHPHYPNPVRSSTTLSYTLHQAGMVRLRLFDLQGRPLATLVEGYYPAGEYQTSVANVPVAAGTYFYTLEHARHRHTRTLTIIK